MKFHSCFACLFACSLLFSADNDKYVIEAKGEFGKELKNLVEKYAKDENVSINVYQKDDSNDGRLLNIGVNKNQNFNIKAGEIAYNKNCLHCHGEKGEKRAMGASQKLSEMSAEDIEANFSEYGSDPEFGGKLKYIMQPYAKKISYRDLGNIIAYLKGENAFVIDDENSGNTDIQTTPTEQGTYLK